MKSKRKFSSPQLSLVFSKRRTDITGQKFNKLSIIEFSHYRHETGYWRARCDCGTFKIVNGTEVKRGGVKSCGCLYKEEGERRRKPKKVKVPKAPSGKIINCETCGKEFYRHLCFINKTNFCSRRCHHKALDQNKRIELNCLECGRPFIEHECYVKLRGRKYCSTVCTRKARSKAQSGENSPWWKGGISYQKKRIRKGVEWKMWRTAIFQRDNYTCRECGARSGKGQAVELHPHHIRQYALYPELRFDVNNGITLCKECHKKTDTYLKPIRNKNKAA